MGLLGLLTGWDQDQAACNAVMANHLIPQLTNEQKRRIAEQLGDRLVDLRFKRTSDAALAHVSESCRVTQMNFVANVCLELGIHPTLDDGAGFRRVTNPFVVGGHTKPRDIDAVLRSFRRKNPNLLINWPGDEVRINFQEWLH